MSVVVDARGEGRQRAVAETAAALLRGALAVVPTDTVYGVAADAFSPASTARVFAAKQRSRALPLPVLVASPGQLDGFVAARPEAAERLMAAYWPGPLTIVLHVAEGLNWDLGDNQGTVAVRMPDDEVCLAIIRAVGPLAVTSANLTGQAAATAIAQAQAALGDAVAVYVDDGSRTAVAPSTIVDLTRSEPLLIRDGDLPPDQVMATARGDAGAGGAGDSGDQHPGSLEHRG